MDWREIPSLAGLRAFEATARRKNYSVAARELKVTDAAVRQHVRGLEEFFGLSLVVRSGRGIALTENGTRLAASVASGFQTLLSGVEDLRRENELKPLKITLTPAFAENWLMPRLGRFWAEYPDIEIELAPSLKVMELTEGGFDLAIRYGHGHWPGYICKRLASAEDVIVATPVFLSGRKTDSPGDLARLPWLFETGREDHRTWAEAQGIDYDAEQNRHFPSHAQVLDAVRRSSGLSLQARALVEADLKARKLVEIFAEEPGSLGYYILTRPRPGKKLDRFMRWLKAAA